MHLPTTDLNDHISFVLYMSNTIHILGEFFYVNFKNKSVTFQELKTEGTLYFVFHIFIG